MRLKQICNHPSHWLGDAAWAEADSGKLARLREIAEVIAGRQEKARVFTRFREVTAPLAAFLESVFGSPGLVLHGGTPVKTRQALVRRFQEDEAGELGHWWPQVLPDGQTVIFTSIGSPIETSRILARSLESGHQKAVIQGAVTARATPSGHLLFGRTETVMAAPFDLARAEVTGTAVSVAEGILFSHQNALSHFAVSEAGVLAVVRATAVSIAQKLVAVDRTGTVQVLREHLKTFGGPRLSPDGRQVALSLMDGSKPPDVWLFDLERGSLSRFTFGPASNFNPVWTPDGRRIVYSSERPVFDLYAKASDATTPQVPVAVSSSDKYANAITPDGCPRPSSSPASRIPSR